MQCVNFVVGVLDNYKTSKEKTNKVRSKKVDGILSQRLHRWLSLTSNDSFYTLIFTFCGMSKDWKAPFILKAFYLIKHCVGSRFGPRPTFGNFSWRGMFIGPMMPISGGQPRSGKRTSSTRCPHGQVMNHDGLHPVVDMASCCALLAWRHGS